MNPDLSAFTLTASARLCHRSRSGKRIFTRVCVSLVFLFLFSCASGERIQPGDSDRTTGSAFGTDHESSEIPDNATVQLTFLKRVKTDAQPKQVCIHPDRNEFYIVNLNNGGGALTKKLGPGTLQVFALDTFELLHEEPARTAVECMIVSRDRLLYSDMFRDEVVHFDLENRKVLTRSPIKPDSIKNFGGTEYRFMPKIIEPRGKGKALVTLWLGGMAEIDYENGNLLRHFKKFCALPRGILPRNESQVYILCYGIPHGPGEIVLFDLVQEKVISRIATGGSPRHAVILKDGTALISNLNTGQIYHFDPASGTFLRKMRLGGGINTIDVGPANRFLFISQRELDLVSVLDLRTWKVILEQKVGDYPTGLDVSYDGKYMAVTNFHEASVDLFRIEYVNRADPGP